MLTMPARSFGLDEILTVTTGHVLTARFAAVHEMVEWLVQRPVLAHELSDVTDGLVVPFLRALWPWLATIEMPAVASEAEAYGYVSRVAEQHLPGGGRSLRVPQIPMEYADAWFGGRPPY